MASRCGQRAIVVLLVVAGAVVVAFAWRLRVRWWEWQASLDRRPTNGTEPVRGPPWEKLVALGDDGFFALARLLENEHPVVWVRAAMVIDSSFAVDPQHIAETERLAHVQNELRSRFPLAFLRYMIVPPYQHGTDWRYEEGYRATDCSLGGDYSYWCGERARSLKSSPAGVRFLETVLDDRIDYLAIHDFRDAFKKRAIHALCAMLERGDVAQLSLGNGTVQVQAGSSLTNFIRSAADPELRLHAIHRLLSRVECGLAANQRHLPLSAWEARCNLGWPGTFVYWDTSEFEETFFEPYAARFTYPGEISALVRLNHARALRVLVRLERDTALKPLLEQALRAPLSFLEMPGWRPYLDAAVRFLDGSNDDRYWAALALADLNDPAAVPILSKKLVAETDANLQRLYRACLLSLGQAEWREAVLKDFKKEPLRVLATPILKLGDRELLERVIGLLLGESAPWDLFLALADAVQDFPIWGIVSFGGLREETEPSLGEKRLAAWWSAHKDHLRFDPAKRLWVTDP